MYAVIDICNFAISHLGVDSPIANLNETSVEARTCKQFFNVAKETTLRSYPWTFASPIEPLELVETFDEENRGYGYSYGYRYPFNALRIFALLDDSFNPRRGSIPTQYYDYDGFFRDRVKRIPYKLFEGSNGKIIHTDAENARAWISRKDVDSESFPSDFAMALSYFLAFLLAPKLARGEKGAKEEVFAAYNLFINQAKQTAANEEEPEPEAASDFERSRL